MADIIYGYLKDMNLKELKNIRNNYTRYLVDNNVSFNMNERFAKITIHDYDIEETIYSFIDMCYSLKVSIIIVDFLFVGNLKLIENTLDKIDYLGLWEIKLNSRDIMIDAYGIGVDYRK